jgi:hypothetical protein
MDGIWRETHLVGKGAFPNLPHSRQGMTSVVPQPPPRQNRIPKTPSSSGLLLPRPCHPERSEPIFSSAPNHGASGRAARLVRPARFAGVEGSLFSFRARNLFPMT